MILRMLKAGTNYDMEGDIRLKKSVSEMVGDWFSFIFPDRCVSCKSIVSEENRGVFEIFCKVCEESIVERGENFCPICGVRFEGITGESRCGECVKNEKPFNRLIYHFVYGGAVQDAIRLFKYNHHLLSGRILTYHSLLKTREEISRFDPDLIIPVPLHIIKYFIRSFSTTSFISSYLSEMLDIPVEYNVLKKISFTRSQVGLSREERLKNLKGSISINKKKIKLISDKKILLVDDVYTTGATASICADILLKNGATSVAVFVLARGE